MEAKIKPKFIANQFDFAVYVIFRLIQLQLCSFRHFWLNATAIMLYTLSHFFIESKLSKYAVLVIFACI